MMLPAGTPTDRTPSMISRTISGDEQQAGAPDGLILIPTMSEGSTNLAQAARNEGSPVNSFIPRSIIPRTTDCDTRLRTMDSEWLTSTTVPGNNPGIPSEDFSGRTPWTTCIGGGSGRVTSPKALGSMPSRKRLALPRQLALTKVLRSIESAPFGENVPLRLRHGPFLFKSFAGETVSGFRRRDNLEGPA